MLATDSAATNEVVNAVGVANLNPHTITLRPTSNKGVLFWLSIGIQQWGYFYESQSDTDYRHFPVAFTTFLLPVLGKAYYLTTEPDGYVPYIEYLGSNNFLCGFGNNRIGNAYVPIMVIGTQQWGSNFSTVTAETLVDYPIAVSQVLTILCAADQTDIRDAEYAAPGTVTDTNFIAVTFALFGSTHAQPYPYYWIMVGIAQQWGTFPYNSNRWTYPIAFNLIFAAVKTTISDNTSEVGYPAWYSWSSDVTNTYAPHISSYKGYAIALGMQQWGCGQHNDNITFSMLYSEIPVTVMGANAYAAYCGIKDNTLTVKGFTGQCCTYSSWSPKSFYWLAIGQQQNKGQLRSLYWYNLVLYPPEKSPLKDFY